MTFVKTDREVLLGALMLEGRGEYLMPGNRRGRASCRRLADRGLFRLMGFTGPLDGADTRSLWALTDAGRKEARRLQHEQP